MMMGECKCGYDGFFATLKHNPGAIQCPCCLRFYRIADKDGKTPFSISVDEALDEAILASIRNQLPDPLP